jgi:hypothetical protein
MRCGGRADCPAVGDFSEQVLHPASALVGGSEYRECACRIQDVLRRRLRHDQ